MHVLTSDDWCIRASFLGTCNSARVLELQTLFFKTSLDGARVTMVDLTLLDRGHSVGVLFG